MDGSRLQTEVVARKAIIVAGVSGCGKSTIGHELAKRIGWPFLEADDFHSEASRAKMIAGKSLDDADRAPWLAKINAKLLQQAPTVLACSALKQIYRDQLAKGLATRFVWIRLSRELAMQRVSGRNDHFMPTSLVDSQFETAEIPREAIFLSAAEPIEESVRRCTRALGSFLTDTRAL